MAMACSPATPTPTISTCAGRMVPAAVVSRREEPLQRGRGDQHRLVAGDGRLRGQGIHHCAREMRGTSSMAKLVMPRALERRDLGAARVRLHGAETTALGLRRWICSGVRG